MKHLQKKNLWTKAYVYRNQQEYTQTRHFRFHFVWLKCDRKSTEFQIWYSPLLCETDYLVVRFYVQIKLISYNILLQKRNTKSKYLSFRHVRLRFQILY